MGQLDTKKSVPQEDLLRGVIPGLTRNPVVHHWIPAYAGMTLRRRRGLWLKSSWGTGLSICCIKTNYCTVASTRAAWNVHSGGYTVENRMNKRSSDIAPQEVHLMRFSDQDSIDEVAKLLRRASAGVGTKRTTIPVEEPFRNSFSSGLAAISN